MKTIGASFSGGGFRAAAFTFGCLETLDRAKLGAGSLLENMAFSSSTSGGSIAMALHALRSYDGMPLADIVKEAKGHMVGDALLAEAFRILEDEEAWAAYPTKTRNLINAFAIAYDTKIFGGATLSFLADKSKRPPVARYCFNTTEMNHGLSFRFDLDGDPGTIDDVGNGRQRFAPGSAALVHQIRLADVAAASSCFPVGFEPMVFPDDLERKPRIGLGGALRNERKAPLDASELPFGVVDGGAVDNQGLRSLQIEAGRRVTRGLPAFDLLLICDVSSFYMDRYDVPKPGGAWSGGLRVWHLLVLALLAGLGVLAGLGLAIFSHAWAAVYALALPACLVVGGLFLVLRMMGGSSTGTWGMMLNRFGLPLLRRMSIRTLKAFITPRLRTMGLLLNSVFMNEIRRQQYRSLYEGMQPRIPIISCMVYELATKNAATLERRMEEKRELAVKAGREVLWDAAVAALAPSKALRAVADSAAEMPTTLWFDETNRSKLEDLLACGRFTMCFNLLVQLAERIVTNGSLTAEETALQQSLLGRWSDFQTNPHT